VAKSIYGTPRPDESAGPSPVYARTERVRLYDRFRGGGACPPRHPHLDILMSWIGGFCGIFAVTVPAAYLHVASPAVIGLIGSFGASAVLIYGLPRAELAQPRNFVGGHIVSATVGVATYQLIGHYLPLAAAVAVATAIAGMHLTRTLHPPGGATALIAVTGGPTVYRLGFEYVAAPVAVGVAMMLVVALLVNNVTPHPRRNYPHYWW
jgi:CBS-domain-containing membrane protein